MYILEKNTTISLANICHLTWSQLFFFSLWEGIFLNLFSSSLWEIFMKPFLYNETIFLNSGFLKFFFF